MKSSDFKGADERRRMARQPYTPSIGVHVLELARAAASPVGRVLDNNLEYRGSGFMISSHLLLTNNHVIRNPEKAAACLIEFNYELDRFGAPKQATRFKLSPTKFFFSSPREEFDFTIVAIGKRVSGKSELSSFGYCRLGGPESDYSIGDSVNIIHHPSGSYKQIVLHAQLVARTDEVLHYYANTKSGSSGSPVFNEQYELLGLHHYRRPSRNAFTKDGKLGPKNANEGIRTSVIAKQVSLVKDRLRRAQRALIDAALA